MLKSKYICARIAGFLVILLSSLVLEAPGVSEFHHPGRVRRVMIVESFLHHFKDFFVGLEGLPNAFLGFSWAPFWGRWVSEFRHPARVRWVMIFKCFLGPSWAPLWATPRFYIASGRSRGSCWTWKHYEADWRYDGRNSDEKNNPNPF